MVVRIRLKTGKRIRPERARRRSGRNRSLAAACGSLLIPAALMAYVLGFWRLLSDMGMAGEFAITGLFSHWQIWIVAAVALQIASYTLNRYGRGADLQLPRVFFFRLGKPVGHSSTFK